MSGYPSSLRILVAHREDLPSGEHAAFQLAWKYWLCFPLRVLSDSEVGWSLRQNSWLCREPPVIACQGWWARCQLLSCGGHCGCSGGGSSVTTEESQCLWEVGLELVPVVRERNTQGCGAQRNDSMQYLTRKEEQRGPAWYPHGDRGWR